MPLLPPPRVDEPSTALLLPYFASSNRSLFAAQCLVEVVVQLYREGRSFEELQLLLRMPTQARWRQQRRGARSSGGLASPAVLPPAEEAVEAATEELPPPLLQSQEEDVLVSWVALVYLTLDELGVPRQPPPPPPDDSCSTAAAAADSAQAGGSADGAAGGGGTAGPGGGLAAGSPYLRGMLGYVRQTLGMYDEGQTLARIAGLQGLTAQSAGASPFLQLMQQYTRLALLTVEVAAAAGLPTARPLRPPETVVRPSGYATAFSSACSAAVLDLSEEPGAPGGGGGEGAAQGALLCPSRGLAVRLLMAFMGAVLGSAWSMERFVEAVRLSYDQGIAAEELFSQLQEDEFTQSGGLLPIAQTPPVQAPSSAAPQPAPPQEVTKQLFGTWISLSYMTLAQLGVPYPRAGERAGWAWAGSGGPVEAVALNDFVANVLRQMAGTDPRSLPLAQPPQAPPVAHEASPEQTAAAAGDDNVPPTQVAGMGAEDVAGAPAARVEAGGGTGDGAELPGGAGAPDPLAATAAGAAVRRRVAPLPRVEDASLPATSTAFRVLSQQVALVQALCLDAVFP